MSCPTLIGEPPGALDHLVKIGDFIYGENLSASLAPVQKITYPDLDVDTTLFVPGLGGGGAADVRGFAIALDETALLTEQIPSGTTSHGNVGPLCVYYRIDPDGTITTIATAAIGTASSCHYSTATGEYYTRVLGGTNAWHRIDMTTGALTSVITGLFDESVTTSDGAIWATTGGTQITRWMPLAGAVATFTVAAFTSNLIPVGNHIWLPSPSGTGRSVAQDGTVTDEDCMSGFPAIFSAAQDLVDPTISICIDSSPLDLYEIIDVQEYSTVVIGSGSAWKVGWI